MTENASLASRKNSNKVSSFNYRQKQRQKIARAYAILAIYGVDAASVESSANTLGSAAVEASPNRGSDLATIHCVVENGVTETEAALARATIAQANREKEQSRLRVNKSRQSKHAAKHKTVCVVDGTTEVPEPDTATEICDAMVVERNKSADLPRCCTRATSQINDDSTSKLYLRGQLVLPPVNWVEFHSWRVCFCGTIHFPRGCRNFQFFPSVLSSCRNAVVHAFHDLGPGLGWRGHWCVDFLGFSVLREFLPPNEYSVMWVPSAFVMSAIVLAWRNILTLLILIVSLQFRRASIMHLSCILCVVGVHVLYFYVTVGLVKEFSYQLEPFPLHMLQRSRIF